MLFFYSETHYRTSTSCWLEKMIFFSAIRLIFCVFSYSVRWFRSFKGLQAHCCQWGCKIMKRLCYYTFPMRQPISIQVTELSCRFPCNLKKGSFFHAAGHLSRHAIASKAETVVIWNEKIIPLGVVFACVSIMSLAHLHEAQYHYRC